LTLRAAESAVAYERPRPPQVSHIGLFVDDLAVRLRAQRMGLAIEGTAEDPDEA
jgi:hypothetical protein